VAYLPTPFCRQLQSWYSVFDHGYGQFMTYCLAVEAHALVPSLRSVLVCLWHGSILST